MLGFDDEVKIQDGYDVSAIILIDLKVADKDSIFWILACHNLKNKYSKIHICDKCGACIRVKPIVVGPLLLDRINETDLRQQMMYSNVVSDDPEENLIISSCVRNLDGVIKTCRSLQCSFLNT